MLWTQPQTRQPPRSFQLLGRAAQHGSKSFSLHRCQLFLITVHVGHDDFASAVRDLKLRPIHFTTSQVLDRGSVRN